MPRSTAVLTLSTTASMPIPLASAPNFEAALSAAPHGDEPLCFGSGVREDLIGIWEYIAADNLKAADEWMETLYAQFDYLAEFPRAGHPRPDLADSRPLLFWPVGAYLIIYRIHDNGADHRHTR